jgi:UrcA family protein
MPNRFPAARRTLAAIAIGGLALAAVPAAAQTLEELTITGRLGPDGRLETLSEAVSYADLDLRYRADQQVLRQRIRDTARSICRRLGADDAQRPSPSIPTCESEAVNGAMPQFRTALARAPNRALARAQPAAPYAGSYSAPVSAVAPAAPSYSFATVTNGPVPDTAENRARYGSPMSRAGRMTAPRGN